MKNAGSKKIFYKSDRNQMALRLQSLQQPAGFCSTPREPLGPNPSNLCSHFGLYGKGSPMKNIALSLFVLVIAPSALAQNPRIDTGRTPAFGACVAGNKIIMANTCEGQTLGHKVNAADAVLGGSSGEIWLTGGGAFGDENSRVIISSNHTLRIFPGVYTSSGYFGVIILNDDTSLVCTDPANTILEEPTHAPIPQADMWGIVQASGTFTKTAGTLIPFPNRNISVRGCHFKGARKDSSPIYRTVNMGNCHSCEVSGNSFDGMNVIATGYGFPAEVKSTDPLGLGLYADGSSIHDNYFVDQNGFALALTNAQNIRITNNTYLRPRLGFSLFLDIEPDTSGDRIVRILVSGNIIDFEGTKSYGAGMSITNNARVPYVRYREILIEDNTLNGAADSGLDLPSRKMQNGIKVIMGATDVQIRNNTIRFTIMSAVHVDGSKVLVQGNSIFGTNGYPIYLSPGSSQSVVSGNYLICDAALTVLCSTTVRNEGTSNVVDGNFGITTPKRAP